MPSSSSKQARFMAAIAHNKDFAKKAGVPQKVGKDFNEADKGSGLMKKAKSERMYSTEGTTTHPKGAKDKS